MSLISSAMEFWRLHVYLWKRGRKPAQHGDPTYTRYYRSTFWPSTTSESCFMVRLVRGSGSPRGNNNLFGILTALLAFIVLEG